MPPWDLWQFRYPFRKYQRIILNQIMEVVDTPQDDRRYHIVAPPGSGKTIIGLELIGRFRRPALVLAPTTTIQLQWRERVRMFLPPEANLEEWVSTEPERFAPILVLTYQRLAVQDPNIPFAQAAARQSWVEELVARGHVSDEDAAQSYLDTLAQRNPDAYRRELRRRYPRIKRRLLRANPREVARFLHPNALKLIERLVAWDLGTVVLDECHHLLDYWAVVLRYLLGRLRTPRVVGLTATLPSPEDDFAYENYTALLGPVDFEIPTPAVVKEGNLAPYRDLVYFTYPTPAEQDYLRDIDQHFERATQDVLTSPHFLAWLEARMQASWQAEADENPAFALAGLRWLFALKRLSADFPHPPEAEEPPTLEDRLLLLEHYALRALLPSEEEEDHRRYRDLRERLRPFGLTLTPRGLRQTRTPGDLVLAFSESKVAAVIDILKHETQALGERLRAVVVTDFERRTGSLRRYRRGPAGRPLPLDAEAGSARFVFRALAQESALDPLHPVLVTGRALWIDRGFRPLFEAWAERFRAAQGLTFRLRFQAHDHFWEVRGEGPDWGTRTYVAMMTAAFEQGLTRCLVGTRGLFGEGWDALRLNVLIDLTTVTTSVGVQQLRGRSLRKDPHWPHKVAHNWDVICVAPDLKQGGHQDLDRFTRRHTRLWGLVSFAGRKAYFRHQILKPMLHGDVTALAQEMHTRIARGVLHVDPVLGLLLTFNDWRTINFQGVTRLMLEQTARREDTYAAWRIGEAYSNFTYRLTHLRPRGLNIRTVYTLEETVGRLLRELRMVFVSALGTGVMSACYILGEVDESLTVVLPAAMLTGALMTIGSLAWKGPTIYRLLRRLLTEQPPDAILLDMGRALLVALREAGLVSRNLQPEYVRVIAHPDDIYTVELDYASPQDAALFAQAFAELFEPVTDQRYLILRTDDRLPHLLTTGVWRFLRWLARPAMKPAYHPVPRVLAVNQKRARAFAQAWRRYVGGGELIYTRSEAGREVLYQARVQRRPRAETAAFEFWV